MLSLPVLFRRDLALLLDLPVDQILAVARVGQPLYGFVILRAQWSPGGRLHSITVTRSGMTLDIERSGRMIPAQVKKVG